MWCILHPVVLGCFYYRNIPNTRHSLAPSLVHECYRYRSGVSPFFRDSSSKNHDNWLAIENFAFFDTGNSASKKLSCWSFLYWFYQRPNDFLQGSIQPDRQRHRQCGHRWAGPFFFSSQYGLCWQNLILKPKSQPNNEREGATPIFMACQPTRLLTMSFPYKALLNSYFWGWYVFLER